MLSRVLRTLVVAVPIVASWGIAVLISRLLPPANSVSTAVLWVAVIAVASLLTLVVLERVARRLLPLAALLDLSLLFPDHAPRRFAVARSSGNPRDLRRRLQRALDEGKNEDARSMQQLIELCLALSVHDRPTRGHSERVRVFTDLIACELQVAEHDRSLLRWAAILHDIGKLEVAATILNKRGRPSAREWESIHQHPTEGARLVAPLLPWLGEWGAAVLQHHERIDGLGYPAGLRGDQISLAARIVSVADCYEVMTAPRSYKRPMRVSAARQNLVASAGTQLDPDVVRAFLNLSVGRLWRIIGFGAWLGQIPVLARFVSNIGAWAGPAAVAGVATATVVGFGGVAKVPPAHLLAAPPLVSPCATTAAKPSSVARATATPSQSAPPLGTTSLPVLTPSSGPSATAVSSASASPLVSPSSSPLISPSASPSARPSQTPARSTSGSPVASRGPASATPATASPSPPPSATTSPSSSSAPARTTTPATATATPRPTAAPC